MHLFFSTPIWSSKIENYQTVNDNMLNYITYLQKKDSDGVIKSNFKAEFGFQKRFPKGESEKSFPPVRCIKMPADDLMREEIPEEKIEIEDKQNIV